MADLNATVDSGATLSATLTMATNGLSAYEVAVKNGYVGTEVQWLASLKGKDGVDGKDGSQGIQGDKGDKGDKGDTGLQGPKGDKGDKGDAGKTGPAGTQGPPGKDGVVSLDSPAFTGTPTAPTAAAATNTTQVATTEFVTTAMKNADSTMSIIAATPNYYARDALFTTAKTTITTPSTLMININNAGYALRSSQTISLALTASWDSDSSTYATAANRAGRDFYIYACVPTSGTVPTIVLSLNSTVPSGYTATNSRKIGGFHCLCADVGTISGHTLSGYVIGDVLPQSVWDLLHRPKCDPEGMAYNAGTDMWNMIYLASWTGKTAANTLKLVSKYGAVTADGTSTEKFHWYKFADTMSQQNMRHPWHREFMAYARGSNQGTNIKGSADVNTTGGHVDTAGRRMISNDGLEDCCGFLEQWIEDTGSASTGSWIGAYDANDFSDINGSSYTNPLKGLAGGIWNYSGYCGSRCSYWDRGALDLKEYIGARGASEPRKT